MYSTVCVLCSFCKIIFLKFFVRNILSFFSLNSCVKFELELIGFFLGTILAINDFLSGSDMVLACVLHCVFDVF